MRLEAPAAEPGIQEIKQPSIKMKCAYILTTSLTIAVTLAGLEAVPKLTAQYDPYNPPPAGEVRHLDQLPPLDQLAAPIALYPDPVVALLLPASTEPDQLRGAARAIYDHRDPGEVGGRWSPAVQGLAHYPELTLWMADNLNWTAQMGAAFASHPHEVMDAIQDLRRRAAAVGTLQSGAQERVVQANGVIQILPAQDDVIYLPRYNPERVYFHGPEGPVFSWSEALPAGPWLGFYAAWDRREIWTGDWRSFRRGHDDHHQFDIGGFGISVGRPDRGPVGAEWRPRPDSPAFQRQYAFRDGRDIARPGMMRGAPGYRSDDRRSTFSGDSYRPGDDRSRSDQRRDDDRDRYQNDQRPDDPNRN